MEEQPVLCAKFQFEIRFSHILDFRDQYKSVVAPYLKLVSGFQILNQQTLEEYIRLEFLDSFASIEVRWDRIIFLTEDDLGRLKPKSFLVVKILFEIYSKLRALESFGLVANYIASIQGVQVHSMSDTEANKQFLAEYLNEAKIKPWVGRDKLVDLAFITELAKPNGIEVTITHGPYHGMKDVQRRGLIPFKSQSLLPLMSAVGRMVDIKIMKKATTIDHDDFVECIKIVHEYQDHV